MSHLYVGFDGLTVAVRSEVEGVLRYVREVFDHMIVEVGTNCVAEIDVVAENQGFTLRSNETDQYPGTPAEHFLPVVKESIRVHFMKARRDLLWMHAAAVAKDDSCILIAAPSGQGKSTISTLLTDRGWGLLSDDIAPLSISNNYVIPFPMRPVRRVPLQTVVGDDEIHTMLRESVPIRKEGIRRQPARLRAIVVVTYRPDEMSSISQLPPGTGALEVLRNLTNFIDHKGQAVAGIAGLARSIPIYSLRYSNQNEAVSLVDKVF
jgi:hypothetical protein